MLAANYAAPNSIVARSLGRNLSGNAANVTINLVPPGTMYGDRVNELDRIAVLVEIRGRAGADRFEQRLLFVLCGQDDDADVRQLAADALRDLDAGGARQIRLDDEHIGLELERLRRRLLSIRRGANELDVGFLLEHLADAHRREPAGVCENDTDVAIRVLRAVNLVGQGTFLFQRA